MKGGLPACENGGATAARRFVSCVSPEQGSGCGLNCFPMAPSDPCILGIDPGLRVTGYGAIRYRPGRTADLLDAGVIRLSASGSMADRLVELERELVALLDEVRPDVVAVETLYAHYAHPRTAIQMAHARGVILLAAGRAGLRLEQIPANRIKKSLTGFGHAGKDAMQRATQAYWKLPEPPNPPDVADALAIALCCGRAMEQPSPLRARR